MYHAAGIHEWPGFESFSTCEHEALTEEQRRKKVWLPIESPAHNPLKEVAWKPKLLKDILLFADCLQTGGLGSFSSYHGQEAPPLIPALFLNCNEIAVRS